MILLCCFDKVKDELSKEPGLDASVYERVKRNPKFTELVTKRSRFAWTLSAVMIGVYYLFIVTIAFFPEILAESLGDSIVTVGIPVGLGIIFLSFFITGIYVFRANKEFDALTTQIKNEVKAEL